MTNRSPSPFSSKRWTAHSSQRRSHFPSAPRGSKCWLSFDGSRVINGEVPWTGSGPLQLGLQALDLLLDESLGQVGDDLPRDLAHDLLGDLRPHALGDRLDHVLRHGHVAGDRARGGGGGGDEGGGGAGRRAGRRGRGRRRGRGDAPLWGGHGG